MEEFETLLRYGGHTVTLLHPIVLVFAIVACGLAMFGHRTYLAVPLITALVLVPTGQRLVVEGVDLTIYRIVLACAWLRLVIRSEHKSIALNGTDRAVLWWVSTAVLSFTILWSDWGALVNRLGFACDVLGAYFLVRAVVIRDDDLAKILRTFVWLGIVVALLMVIEAGSGRNVLATLGGVPEFSEFRLGRLRAQGPFSHSILAGTFGATLLPSSMALWWRGERRLAAAGNVAAGVIVWASASSGPVLTLLAGVLGLITWPLRDRMALVRRVIVVLVIGLHIVMKAPVWALLHRVDVVAGSTGWHRFFLIDNFIQRFDEWFLVGTRFTSSWGLGLVDQTNQYVSIGVSGGVLTLALFLLVVKRCFAGLRGAKDAEGQNLGWRRPRWALGSALFAHLTAFMGVAYFGQMQDVWYLFLGMVSAASCITEEPVAAPRRAAARTLPSVQHCLSATVPPGRGRA
jgi:hypothetical protein